MDPKTLKRLEELRPAYDRLRAERIRAEGEIERLTAELEEARQAAREAFGTDDEAALAAMVEAARAENEAAVDAFAARLKAIQERLARSGGAA
jgi:nucleoid-associated protein YejK